MGGGARGRAEERERERGQWLLFVEKRLDV